MKRLKKNERGAALLEAAITIPMILLISVGIFEFGRAYQTWQVLTNAAREGARYAVIDGTSDADVRTRVNNYLSGGGLNTLSDSNITIDRTVPFTGTATCPPCGSRVSLAYPFQFMVLNPIVQMVTPASTTGAPITMAAASLMRNE